MTTEKPGDDFKGWYDARIAYLPGETWPKSWIVQKAIQASEIAAATLAAKPEVMKGILEYGLQAGKHNEFFEIAQNVGLSRQQCLERLCATVCVAFPEDIAALITQIEGLLQ